MTSRFFPSLPLRFIFLSSLRSLRLCGYSLSSLSSFLPLHFLFFVPFAPSRYIPRWPGMAALHDFAFLSLSSFAVFFFFVPFVPSWFISLP